MIDINKQIEQDNITRFAQFATAAKAFDLNTANALADFKAKLSSKLRIEYFGS